MERYFPEIAPLVTKGAGRLPTRSVVDGEIIIPSRRGLAFDSLLLRIHPAASRVALLAEETPASFVAFDLLALGGDDLRDRPFSERSDKLEKAMHIQRASASDAVACATGDGERSIITPRTNDPDEARSWFVDLEHVGLDGVIAKRAESTYLPGKRGWVKIKHKRTADCVVGGYRLAKSKDGIGSLLLGLYDDTGVLSYIGHTSSFKAAERKRLLEELKPLEGGESFGGGRTPGGPSRWANQRETSWVPLKPSLVCEVSFDYLQGARFRHAATFIRWRTDKDPKTCTFDQLAVPGRP
jgi:ATP-dependent DNA ligase